MHKSEKNIYLFIFLDTFYISTITDALVTESRYRWIDDVLTDPTKYFYVKIISLLLDNDFCIFLIKIKCTYSVADSFGQGVEASQIFRDPYADPSS